MRIVMHFATTLAIFGLGGGAAIAQNVNYAWVQYDGFGKPEARAVIAKNANGQTTCPDITYDGGTVAMTLRSDFAPANFDDIRVCIGAVDPSMANMTVGGLGLPTPTTDPQKVAVIGDTGCRVKGGDVQPCKKPDKTAPQKPASGIQDILPPPWDYEGLANAAAAQSPDLFIHMGDMHYRESGFCGDLCDQDTIGFTWVSWEADFFRPSKALFSQAAMIPVRGNHEDCTRAWNGWFYLLDPNPIEATSWPASCPGKNHTPLDAGGNDWSYTLPYPVVFDQFQVIVFDTARIDRDYDRGPDLDAVKQYKIEFSGIELIAQGASVPSWLVTHRPFWAVASYGSPTHPNASYTDKTLQKALQESVQKVLPPQIKMTMAGHVHLAQALEFRDGRPMQFVFGNSGTKRDPNLGDDDGLFSRTKTALDHLQLKYDDFYWSHDFDFGLITPGANDWTVSFNNRAGNVMKSYQIAK